MHDRTCNHCKHPLLRTQRQFCSHLCANRHSHAERSARAKATPRKKCDVDGCDKPSRSRIAALCPMHYHRMYRTRTLDLKQREPAWIDVAGKRFGTLVAQHRYGAAWVCRCDCGATRRASLGELNRTGDANTCGIPGHHLAPVVGYAAAHDRVRRAHGSPSSHDCIDCGRPAEHWSYNHDDPDELYASGLSAKKIPYSLHLDSYSARCVACHKRFDIGRAHHAS